MRFGSVGRGSKASGFSSYQLLGGQPVKCGKATARKPRPALQQEVKYRTQGNSNGVLVHNSHHFTTGLGITSLTIMEPFVVAACFCTRQQCMEVQAEKSQLEKGTACRVQA